LRAIAKFERYENVFGQSAIVSVIAAPALTITVRDSFFRNPLAGAIILVNSSQVTTDKDGKAVFTALAPGTYTVTVRMSGYVAKTITITITEAGAQFIIDLLPLLPLAVAGVTLVGLIIVVGTKLAHWW